MVKTAVHIVLALTIAGSTLTTVSDAHAWPSWNWDSWWDKWKKKEDPKPPSAGVPEINAAGAPVALAIVLGGTAVALGRRRRSAAAQ